MFKTHSASKRKTDGNFSSKIRKDRATVTLDNVVNLHIFIKKSR